MNDHELESIRSFVRSSNHWLNLMPDEETGIICKERNANADCVLLYRT